MKTLILQFGSALLYGTAGFCIFMILLNRALILIADSKAKNIIIMLAFATLIGCGAIFGFTFYQLPFILIPTALLCLILLGEVRRAFIRHSYAGSPPIDTTPHKFNITKPITTTDLVTHRYEVAHPEWSGTPLRIVHLTDLHINSSLPLNYYKQVLTVAEQANPDIAVFTGDFISNIDALPRLREILRPIAKLKTYAVLGNHDYWTDANAVRKIIQENKLHLLSNETVILPIANSNIAITGYDNPWGTKETHIPSQENSMLHMVLSHTPDNIYRISKSSADFVFSGHYHAGQFRAPMIGSIVIPSVYGRRFDHGHFIINNTHLFVASGIGAGDPPLRIYCQPDIFIVDVISEEKDPGIRAIEQK